MDSDENDSQGSSSSDSETEVVNNNEPQSGLTNNNSPGSPQNSDSESSSSRSPSPDEHIKQVRTPQSPEQGSVKSRSDRSPSSDHESVKSEDSRKSQHSKRSRRNSGSSGRESNKSGRRSNSRSSDRGSIASEHRSRSRESVKSQSSHSPKSRQHDDGNSSDSSTSSRGSKRHKSFSSSHAAAVPLENQAEEISDGEMDLEACKDYDRKQNSNPEEKQMQLSHEDLSDVSDLDSMGEHSEDERSQSPNLAKSSSKSPPQDLRQKLDEAKNRKLAEPLKVIEKTSKTEDGEEALDFEAEDGECVEEVGTKDDATNGETVEKNDNADEESVELKPKDPEDLEEGEVTDDDETRPEETEPRPVCRFYSRGQCTWGASCRFLHPGVTDKGNYTMFEMIRPVVPGPLAPFTGPDFRDERPGLFNHPLRAEPPQAESAWERGLRTAKEMVRRSIKRREQDMDFEEKKMNLTLSQDELDKENGYYTRAASPILIEPTPAPVKHFVRHPPAPVHDPYYPPPQRHSEEYYRRLHHYDAATPPVPTRQVRIEPEYEPPPRERIHSYRELPTHRMPDYYNDKYEERTVTVSNAHKRHVRPKREVIVQRIETSAPPGRADEWADPWMRSKSPGARTGRPGRRQSYSSGSSYSSSSSSRSSSGSSRSSSYRRQSHKSNSRSRSGSPRNRRRVAVGAVPPISNSVPGYRRESRRRGRVSPSVIVSERKAAHERAALMNPPAPSPRKPHKDVRPPSPGMMRSSAQNPPAPVNKAGVDQFGRTAKREVDRITSERRNLEPDRKKLVMAAAIAASRVKSKTRSSRSSSGSDSSGWSSSDSESSYSSSSTSREGSPTTGASANPSSKRKPSTDTKSDLASLISLKNKSTDTAKGDVASKKRPASPPTGDGPTPAKVAATSKPGSTSGSGSGKKSTSRREELLKQLKAVEDAIAKKRSRIN